MRKIEENVIGSRIWVLREAAGLTKGELKSALARLSGKIDENNTSIITDWEKGERTPRFSTMLCLAKVFDAPLDYLCGIIDIKTWLADENGLLDPMDFETIKKNIGNNLLILRKQRNMSQAAFGISFSEFMKWDTIYSAVNVSGLEKGVRFPSTETMIGFSRYFDVSIDRFCGLYGEMITEKEEKQEDPVSGPYSSLAKNLKILRQESGYTREEMSRRFAEFCGKDKPYSTVSISTWENGRSIPTLDAVIHLAEFYDVSIDFLVGFKNDRK